MRIVAGRWGGRRLTTPRGTAVRPTADRVREALFSILGGAVEGARVLDLFAGSGALGLEALSRGARYADFVEFRPTSLHALKANIMRLKLRERTRVHVRDALPFAGTLPPDRYDVAFCDPPYESRQLDRVIDHWHEGRFSRVLAVEHARTHVLPPGAERETFDDTAITIYRL